MKKTAILIFMVVAYSVNQAHSELPCDGTLIYASGHPDAGAARNALCAPDPSKCNDHVFCRSNQHMNWFSAWTWCKSQGRNLASIATMCPPGDDVLEGASCPNLQGTSNTNTWSSYGWNSDYAVYVNLSSGYVGHTTRTLNIYAGCE